MTSASCSEGGRHALIIQENEESQGNGAGDIPDVGLASSLLDPPSPLLQEVIAFLFGLSLFLCGFEGIPRLWECTHGSRCVSV